MADVLEPISDAERIRRSDAIRETAKMARGLTSMAKHEEGFRVESFRSWFLYDERRIDALIHLIIYLLMRQGDHRAVIGRFLAISEEVMKGSGDK